MSRMYSVVQYEVSEWAYTTYKTYPEPLDIELDVLFEGPTGTMRVPAWWAGGGEWRVRFSPPQPGAYRFRTACSDASNADLHGREGEVRVSAYAGTNPLLRHGSIRVTADRRHFEHADGTPFFWLGDTWWMSLCKRMRWPEEFQLLTADRIEKGFSVIQIIAGLYPDMPPFDERGANEAGFPWHPGFAGINPAYFDMADLRIAWLARCGLVPCIVGCWGYFLPLMGIEKMKRHWRYLVARWGAYPVVWCLAGEAAMPYYLSKDPQKERAEQIEGWTELARYVRKIDPYRRLVTIHPTDRGREQVTDATVLDFEMLQTGHSGATHVSNTVKQVLHAYAREPVMPVLVGEVNYEGILHGTRDDTQRVCFWSSMLSGSAGHTYGANGIWQLDTREKPFGPSPHGATWGDTPWQEACRLPGSSHLGIGKRLLERFEWWRFEPHQEWVDPAGAAEDYNRPFAAGIPGEVRVIYFYWPSYPWDSQKQYRVRQIEPSLRYRACFLDPRTGREHAIGPIEADPHGDWVIPTQPSLRDWVVVLERR